MYNAVASAAASSSAAAGHHHQYGTPNKKHYVLFKNSQICDQACENRACGHKIHVPGNTTGHISVLE